MKKLATSQDEYHRTALRLPRDLHQQVLRAAEAAGRTMNAELLARIAGADEVTANKELVRQNAELKAMLREIMEAIELLKKPEIGKL
jgi:hypothetical protein